MFRPIKRRRWLRRCAPRSYRSLISLSRASSTAFRKAENIKRVLEAELYFYSKVFGFELADAVEPVKIENLQA